MEERQEGNLALGNENKRRIISRICVFCGSRLGNKISFSEAAVQLGKAMVRKHSLKLLAIWLISIKQINPFPNEKKMIKF